LVARFIDEKVFRAKLLSAREEGSQYGYDISDAERFILD